MSEQDGVKLRSIQWSELFPWLSIARTFRLAVTLRLLMLGALAILFTLLGWAGLARFFAEEHPPAGSWTARLQAMSPGEVIDRAVPDRPILPLVTAPSADAGVEGAPLAPETWHAGDPFFGTWAQLSRPGWHFFITPRMTAAELACLTLSGLWSLAVWAFFGAAITRIAAVQLASDERVGWGAALRWATSKWISYFGAPLYPIAGILVAAVPLAVLGLLLRTDIGVLLVSVIWPLLLVGGFVMALLLLGVAFGWPLMWATISAEGTDTFDALSRTYAYVFQRPLRYLFYAIVAAVLGWLGWLLVANFAAGIIWFASWGASWGSGAERMTEIALTRQTALEGVGYAGAAVIHFWAGCVKWLALGYVYSYFWAASTAIYFLLRRDVDAAEMDEVFLEADETEVNYPLPPLTTDEAGAPQLMETATAPAASEGNGQKTDGPTPAQA